MSRGVNKVLLLGHLGKDPEKKTFANGGAVANATLATSEEWTGKDGNRASHTEWHNLVFNDKLAEIAAQYLRKGSKIYIEGQIRTRKYEDRDGKDRYITEIRVGQLLMLDSKSEGESAGPAAARDSRGDDYARASGRDPGARRGPPAAQPQPTAGRGFEDDDIPFGPMPRKAMYW